MNDAAWKTIDFEGIVSLNQAMVDHLFQYLEEKETQLATTVMHAIHPYQTPDHPPPLIPALEMPVKLSEAVEGLGKQIRQLRVSTYPILDPTDWKVAVKMINEALWEYVETLEECVKGLFHQLSMVGMEAWRVELAHVVASVEEMLMHRLEELYWSLKRLNSHLKEYRWICEVPQQLWKKVKKYFSSWQSELDPQFFSHVSKCQQQLQTKYNKFVLNFKRYIHIQMQVNHSIEKYARYTTFSSLELDDQQKIKKIYSYLKMWELNGKEKGVPLREIVSTLRRYINPEKAFALFREYYKALSAALFDKSRAIKADVTLTTYPWFHHQQQEQIAGLREEVHTLATEVEKYRDFLLRTDPNPYVRSRLGFPEWIVGPEPASAKHLQMLGYDLEKLDHWLNHFQEYFVKNNASEMASPDELQQEIQEVLHEMGQPLLSRGISKRRGEHLVDLLQQMDELTSTNPNSIDTMQEMLSKALRADWKYHVLFDFPAFYDIYAIHNGLMKPSEDRMHINRLQKFKRHIQQIEQWVKSHTTPRHVHEIEADMHDIKGYLQDFLAYVQRNTAQDNISQQEAQTFAREASRQLLEYRYMFGHFFKHLSDTKEERMIRQQFLFVDQYFEAIETRLHEWISRINKR